MNARREVVDAWERLVAKYGSAQAANAAIAAGTYLGEGDEEETAGGNRGEEEEPIRLSGCSCTRVHTWHERACVWACGRQENREEFGRRAVGRSLGRGVVNEDWLLSGQPPGWSHDAGYSEEHGWYFVILDPQGGRHIFPIDSPTTSRADIEALWDTVPLAVPQGEEKQRR